MARIAVADGISTVVCTPHILPTVYDNVGPAIRAAVDELQRELTTAAIPLRVLPGADVHIAPDLVEGLKSGRVLAIADTRYLLLEPTHHVMPPRLQECAFELMTAGYVPILTHPERLTWIEQHYDVIRQLASAGVLMQITAGSLTDGFGRRARHWARQMLDDGLVDVLATDAHDPQRRVPRLSEAYRMIAEQWGEPQARRMAQTLPEAVLCNLVLSRLEARPTPKSADRRAPLWRRAVERLRAR
jgi:protein-tyrosine phosphatase